MKFREDPPSDSRLCRAYRRSALWVCKRLQRTGNEDLNRIQMLRQTVFHSTGLDSVSVNAA
jgi:hypothetical protein